MKLQSIYGLFPRIIGKGDAAKVSGIHCKSYTFPHLIYALPLFGATCDSNWRKCYFEPAVNKP
jgi:hypothetical protein